MNTNKPTRIPRPKNCFMTYRQHKMDHIIKQHGHINNKEISKIAGEMWNKEPEVIKQHFRKLAELGKIEHSKLYPDYKYCPRKNHTNKKRKPPLMKSDSIKSVDSHLPSCPLNSGVYETKLYNLIHTNNALNNIYYPNIQMVPYPDPMLNYNYNNQYVSDELFNQFINVDLVDTTAVEIKSEESNLDLGYLNYYNPNVPLQNTNDQLCYTWDPNVLHFY